MELIAKDAWAADESKQRLCECYWALFLLKYLLVIPGRCSCDRHALAYYWWYLGQLMHCLETIVLCKWFYQKGVFSFQSTLCKNWNLFSQSKPLVVLNFTNTIYYSNVYVSLQLSDVRYQNIAFVLKWASEVHERPICLYEKVLSVTFTFELPFSVSRFLKRFGLEKFNWRCSIS